MGAQRLIRLCVTSGAETGLRSGYCCCSSRDPSCCSQQAPFTLPVPLHHPCCDPCSCCTYPATCRSTVTSSASLTASAPASVSVTVPVTAFVISEWKHPHHPLAIWCCCYSFNCTCGCSCGACCKGFPRRPLTEPTKARHLLHPCFFIR